MAGEGVSLGKGAWDCDTNKEIPPEKEAEVFEEIATMEFPFEGIPTVPPRKDMDHMVKKALWTGGIERSNKPEGKRSTRGLQCWEDLALIYAGQLMSDNDASLSVYHVPPGCQVLIAIEHEKLLRGHPDPDSAYWN
eukprot:gene21027-27896_t